MLQDNESNLTFPYFSPMLSPFLLLSLLPCMPSLPSFPLAMHRTDPQIFPHLVRTVEDQEEGTNRNQRNYLVEKKLITKSEVVRPGINFVNNGQPGKVKIVTKENRQQSRTTTTTTPTTSMPTLITTSSSNVTNPFTWLTNSYLFNGLPTTIFSPMQWVGETLSGFGTVINHSRMGPHVLLG